MNKSFVSFLLFVFSFTSLSLVAQEKGTLRGTVIDDENGEPLFSANVVAKGTKMGTTTDFDGKFELSLEPGTYDIEASFIGMTPVLITGVNIKAGEVNALGTIRITPGSNNLDEVMVSADAVRNTEAAILTMRAKSVKTLDGISSQTFRKIGDGDAAVAVSRVPGVSIQEGKYVYVRGLGDRYTKTTLHGLDIPGLDPDRNSLQMDIFPTNLISNITVVKNFTADMPADFVGGTVNVETSEFPDKPTLRISAGGGFNPSMHFNDQYYTHEGSPTDVLGFDNGFRDEPLGMGPDNPKPTGDFADPRLPNGPTQEQTESFTPELAAKQKFSPMDFSLGVSGGDQYKIDGKTYGFIASLNYKNSTKFYDNWQQNFYRKNARADDIFELRDEVLINGQLGINEVLLSSMVGFALKTQRSKYKINAMHLQNGEKRSGYFNQESLILDNNTSVRDNMEYTQRSISNVLLSGEHVFDGGDTEVSWKVSPTISRMQDKDVRFTPYLMQFNNGDTTYSINPNEVSFPQRLWRNLEETNVASRADVESKVFLGSLQTILKGGLGYTYKQRNYEILNYELITLGGNLPYTGDADELLSEDFRWQEGSNSGTFYFGNYQENNTYSGRQSTISAYASQEYRFNDRFKAILGVRMEKYDQFYTGQNQIANNVDPEDDERARVFNDDKVLDLLDFFPSANVIYALTDKQNLRASFFQTTARPSFKEKSTAEIVDVISGINFIGNIDLEATYINNFDLRYEYFGKKNQMFSISAFYKRFTNPIELVSFQQDPSSFQPRNVGDAQVLGLELEGRLNLDNFTPVLEKFALKGNVSLISSRVTYDKSPNGTYQGRQTFLREGEELGDYRDMQGQAPYLVNGGISYSDLPKGWEAGFYYNVQGPKLMFVGINLAPDIYSKPFHSLNFKLNRTFGERDQYRLGLGVQNILNDDWEQVTSSFNAEERLFKFYNPGRTFTFSFTYELY